MGVDDARGDPLARVRVESGHRMANNEELWWSNCCAFHSLIQTSSQLI